MNLKFFFAVIYSINVNFVLPINSTVSCLEPGMYRYQDTSSNTEKCLKCPMNYYCPDEIEGPIQCPNNLITRSEGQFTVYHCKCGLGHFLDKNYRRCTKCPLNTYMNSQFHRYNNCYECIEHSHSHDLGSKSRDDCHCDKTFIKVVENYNFFLFKCLCDKGFGYNSSTYRCEKCPIGTYKSESGNSGCSVCPEHSSTISTGSTSLNGCQCLQGYYLNETKDECEKCPIGTYKSES
ncbi:MAG: calcium ion binding, partial [Paramarteilia canceri]